ncbi:MAG TPA: prenyltransferase/squalene oxidase repeat-containing protein [Phycisphaerae bacterium]|nr:prenyltransferase/squalene oxidase repeat-containing protein [Phycisphaerae bacterium]
MPIDRPRLDKTLCAAREHLLSHRGPDGHWSGHLAASALSTATAAWALHVVERERGPGPFSRLIGPGLDWLAGHQNHDGGWGDTVLSHSNLSTTILAWSALAASDSHPAHRAAVARAEAYLAGEVGGLEPARLAGAVDRRYGNDRTFSAPILTMAALAGRLGPAREAWSLVKALPFELAACPPGWWNRLRLPVVSYALPALIAIGQARYHFRPPACPVTHLVRHLTRGPTLRRLTTLQPRSGGFLEAAPLTSFVTMSLAAAGQAHHEVVARGVDFLVASARDDGSWPIDTDLATWVTTLAVNALAAAPDFAQILPPDARRPIVDWLLDQQHAQEHFYTRAAPGGWAWTDRPGGVPDADDTAGALLALRHLAPRDPRVVQAAARGAAWLADLQNRDGGLPTFCRGWGTLPFDRSAADLTAHALAAWTAWRDDLPAKVSRRLDAAAGRALAYIEAAQSPEGAWVPLWFGSQDAPDEQNPTYGTARVGAALEASARQGAGRAAEMLARGAAWLVRAQNDDGGWGGAAGVASSIEETALAVDALCRARAVLDHRTVVPDAAASIERGAAWLMARTHQGTAFEPSPIGFYFAKLWYFERLYPIIFTVAALERARTLDG